MYQLICSAPLTRKTPADWRGNPAPRCSHGRLSTLVPPNVSQMPGVGTCVFVGPPLSWSGCRPGSSCEVSVGHGRRQFITLLLLPFQPAPLAPVESAVSNGAAVLTLLLMIVLSRLPDVVM
jgi:hypothetical protein